MLLCEYFILLRDRIIYKADKEAPVWWVEDKDAWTLGSCVNITVNERRQDLKLK